ncbi:carotenoid ester lipase-like protein precursor [Stemphylium lycopersici]|uniref:Carboxylic ester hydrolase n=1 Tax=Stemphylium lycopersici TaxID=183478 RepID=A0A364MR71_STELY|nr:hypothetical protein TW65_04519 [Stemphylium lycopersici]RAQ98550.1 carotenoid ester lipase-like protein precursor [Stemphylium lycopersici]RAQ99576.1 carotenoid ester lipase-like protein precursor [Stemphylium lycopersici]
MFKISTQVLLLHFFAYTIATSSTLSPTANTTNGTLIGIHNTHYDQDFFLGIPYAEPPTGELRFQRPKPVAQPWKQRNATEIGPSCHSAPLSLPLFTQTGFPYEESEDCLKLNVVRPASAHNSSLPVLVFIYGGGFQEGNAADQRYNMSFLVQESVNVGSPIIGVTINYRTTGFGFLAGSVVLKSGLANLGMHDQRLALGWIQDNIASFGGDPSRVTIQGESAGAIAVGYHFVAYKGRDDRLFRAGIAQSGGPAAVGVNLTLSDQNSLYNSVLNQTGCTHANDTLKCLRGAPVETLKAAFQGNWYVPVQDGDMIAESPYVSLKEGRFVKRPLLSGANTNEGTSFITGERVSVNTTTQFRTVVAGYLNQGLPSSTVDAVAAEYLDRMAPEDVQASLGTVLPSLRPENGLLYGRASLFRGDQFFIASRRFSAHMWAKHGIPNYSYRFDTVPNGAPPKTLGATHYSDIPFVFGNVDGVGHEINLLASNSTREREEFVGLSRKMGRMWISFINEMQPNADYARSI